jgi:4a-hydroxytetrahydrobiopterin dehydratase
MNKLTDEEITQRLEVLSGWELRERYLEKDFEFADFRSAIAFMNRLVPVAEALNHHPDWSNTYNKVKISLTTHEVGGLTEDDFSFAAAANEAASRA